MSAFREELLNRMIGIYGLEHPIIIQFAEMCETNEENEWNNTVLKILVEAHEANPFYEEE